MSAALRGLAQAHGIALAWRDNDGVLREAGDGLLRDLLASMGVDASSDARIARAVADVDRARCRTPLAAMTVVRGGTGPWSLRACLPEDVAARTLRWEAVDEAGVSRVIEVGTAGASRAGVVDDGDRAYALLDVGIDGLPVGYHALTLRAGDLEAGRGALAVAPARCFRPPGLRDGRRGWGAATQLYGLRSSRNWGLGDFTDLAAFARTWGAAGADVVGVNPLHALFPDDPARASPYSPSSRRFLNVLYLDVEAIPEFASCAEARELSGSSAFRAAIDRARSAPLVDYAAVAALKMPVLERLYAYARRDEAGLRWRAFEAFERAGGAALATHALFEALHAHFRAQDDATWGWPAWPAAYRHPGSDAVRRFADERRDDVRFRAWLQWQAHEQRAAAARLAQAGGLAIGLYADLAVSVDRGGADAWAAQDLYAIGASVGAPPDGFNAHGQDWGLPPIVPARLAAAGYAPFIEVLRASMRDAGALRVDHAMGLSRLYWIPAGAPPSHGTYVRYPLDDLAGLLALESERHACLVIGEDLGTVPDDIRAAMATNDMLSYRVLLFERDAVGAFRPPAEYPEASLAAASTHDLPTLAGWWEGRDIALRAEHGQLPDRLDRDAAMAERAHDRARLVEAVAREGLVDAGTPGDPASRATLDVEMAHAILAFLARSRSALLVVQPEDVFGEREQANLPGTVDEHPNWRRKLAVPIEAHAADPRFVAVAALVAREREGVAR